jgi:methyl coenzyme M reductase beta subunit
LRREPAFIIRKNGSSQSFINVIEIHGKFDPIIEFSTNSYSSVQNMKMLENDDYSVIEIFINGKKILIAQSNKDFDKTAKHSTAEISWTGPYTVLYDEKILK